MNSWYSISEPRAAGGVTEVYIYDEIGMWGVSASAFVKDLRAVKGDILVRLNSPGGSVPDGLAIYNALRRRSGKVDTVVDGWACSMAAIILLAGEDRSMGEGSSVMVHAPSMFAGGTAEEIRKKVQMLEKWHEQLRGVLIDRTGADEVTVDEWMSDDTWFFGEEAVDAGLATETFAQAKVAACFDLKASIKKFNTPPPPDALEVFASAIEETTNMKEVLKALGLKEDASEKSALEAVNALSAKVAAAEADTATAKEEATTATNLATEAETAKTAAEAAQQAAVTALAESVVASAVAAGKIEDKDEAKASWTAAIEANPEARVLLEGIPGKAPSAASDVPGPIGMGDNTPTPPVQLTGIDRVKAALKAKSAPKV